MNDSEVLPSTSRKGLTTASFLLLGSVVFLNSSELDLARQRLLPTRSSLEVAKPMRMDHAESSGMSGCLFQVSRPFSWTVGCYSVQQSASSGPLRKDSGPPRISYRGLHTYFRPSLA